MAGTDTSTGLSGGGMPSETLSDAERSYFESKGADVAGLGIDTGGTDGGTPPAAAKVPAADGGKAAPGAADPAADDEDGDIEAITIGADGKARDNVSGKYVSHQAFHKERERRKSAEGTVKTLSDRLTRGEERLAVLLELVNGADPAKAAPGAKPGADGKAAEVDPLDEEPIDPDEDIFGALKQAQRQNAALRKRMQDGAKADQEKEQRAAVGNSYKADALAFAKREPQFGAAYNYLIDSMHGELEAMGVADQAEREKIIAAREKSFVQEVLNAKASPAEALFKVAKVRGFKGAAPAADAGGGDKPKPAPAADPAAAEKLRRINEAKESVVSLGASGGSAGGEPLTYEALQNMSEAEFQAVSRKLGKAGMARLLGG